MYVAASPTRPPPFCDFGDSVTAFAGAAGSEIANTCMSPPVACGSVMLATVLATDTGASRANTCVFTLSFWLPLKLRYSVVTASKLPGSGVPPPPPSVQSLNFAVNCDVVPSVYVTVAVPPAPEPPAFVELPSSPILDACAGAARGIVCPLASMLSSVATGTSGQT